LAKVGYSPLITSPVIFGFCQGISVKILVMPQLRYIVPADLTQSYICDISISPSKVTSLFTNYLVS
jgi:hypothetical protein